MSSSTNASAIPVGMPGRIDFLSPAQRMAVFDALPAGMREAINYAPFPMSMDAAAQQVSLAGPSASVLIARQFVAQTWRALGADPLRP